MRRESGLAMAISLTVAQETVARRGAGRLLVFGGPGTGKTKTAAVRLALLNAVGASPDALRLIVPSRRARIDVAKWLSDMGKLHLLKSVVPISTLGTSILRRESRLFYRSPGFAVLSPARQREAFQVATSAREVQFDARAALNLYADAKASMVTAMEPFGSEDALAAWVTSREPDVDAREFAASCSAYEHVMRRANSFDGPDLLCLPGIALKRAGIKLDIGTITDFIIDDFHSFPDPAVAIYKAIPTVRSLTVFGDDDQAGPNRAARAAMTDLAKQPDVTRVELSGETRGGVGVRRRAAAHIAFNKDRIPKRETEPSGLEFDIKFIRHEDGPAMASGIATLLAEAIRQGIAPDRIAVLYRSDAMELVVRKEIEAAGIRVASSSDSIGRSHPKVGCAIAAIRLMRNPKSADAVLGLKPLMSPRTASSLDSIVLHAHEVGGSLAEATEAVDGECYAEIHLLQESLANLWATGLSSLEGFVGTANAGVDGPDVVAILSEMAARSLPSSFSHPDWESILTSFPPLISDPGHVDGHVSLRTIEQAVGMEWDIVHVAGYTLGILPSADKPVEHERSISYIAITRATQGCFLHHAERLPFMDADKLLPSVFLNELDIHVPGMSFEAPRLDGPQEAFKMARLG